MQTCYSIQAFLPCCSPFESYSIEARENIDIALGNIKKTHSQITYAGLMNVKRNMAQLVHYHMSPSKYMHATVYKDPARENDSNYNSVMDAKLKQAREAKKLKRSQNMVTSALEVKQAQDELAKTMGFDYSSEVFIKGETSIVIIFDLGGLEKIKNKRIDPKDDEDFKLVLYFEMDPIKVDLFDCDTYVITIDDLVVQLIEALKTDKQEEVDDDE